MFFESDLASDEETNYSVETGGKALGAADTILYLA
jgi:hypothetical protein